MVSNPGRATDTRRIRRLKQPRGLEVEADAAGMPRRIRQGSGWQTVSPARPPWRVDQYWWRAMPVRRTYYRLELQDGPPLTIYYDEVSRAWFRQEY